MLEARGLTGLALDAARSRFEYAGGAPRVALDVLPGGADPGRALRRGDRARAQRAVRADGPIDPFRFFASTPARLFHLGLAYDHFIAGGDSIVELLA